MGDGPTDAAGLPAPTVLARLPGCGAARLVVAGGKVLWTERATGAVKSLAAGAPGGTPAVVAANQPMPGAITADDTNVYWANEGDRTIMKAPLAGGAATPLLTAPEVVAGIVASAGTVYYGAGPSTYKVASAGGAPVTLMTFPACRTSTVGAVALDATHLYQTDHNQLFLTRERIDGTQMINDRCAADPPNAPKIQAPDTISHSQGGLLLDALAVVGGEVVWADHGNINAKAGAGDTTTGSRPVAYTLGGNTITGFAVAGASVYFGESADPPGQAGAGAVEVAPLDPGEAGAGDPTIVARDQPNAGAFTADATHVYWVTRTASTVATGPDDCALVRLPR
jgi:hypothetical protein